MNCDEIRRLLAAFGDASLPEPGRVDVSRHLQSCADCRGRAERRERLGSLLQAGHPVPDPGEIHFERQRARILAAAGAPARRSRLVLLAAGAFAAAAAFMVIAGPPLLRRSRPAESLPPEPIARSEAAPGIPLSAPPRTVVHEPSSVSLPPQRPAETAEGPVAAKAGPPAGTAGRVDRMTREAVEVALAETPTERVAALCGAAEAQLRELSDAIAKDPALAVELAAAYCLLVGEGVAAVLRDRDEPETELAAARDVAVRRARDHEVALAALRGGASGPLKESLGEALAVSRALSGR